MLELALLSYILLFFGHVYWFPELWNVHLVSHLGMEPVIVDRFLVEPKIIPQVTSLEGYQPPISNWRLYWLAIGYVWVKFMRVGPKKAIRNFTRRKDKLLSAMENFD
jgi:hypothetical protein